MMLRASYKTISLIAVFALFILAILMLPVASWLETLIGWVSGLGMPGIAVLVALYAVAAVLFVPGSILTMGAGAVFGLFWGTVAASLGATLGAGAAFLVGRYLARERIARWVEANPRFAAIDAAVKREGGRIVLLTRLSPVFPYNLLNYLFGITGVGFWRYLFASWAGMLPGAILYVYLGVAGRAAAQAASGGLPAGKGKVILWSLGLVATALLTYQLTRLARRSLAEPPA